MKKTLTAAIIVILIAAIAAVLYFKHEPAPKPTNRAFVGQATTLAGTGRPGLEDGPAGSSTFTDPFGIAIDDHGEVVVADGGHANRIRRITRTGIVKTIAGSDEGFRDGPADSAMFNTPSGIALTRKGEIIVADTTNNRIRRIGRDGIVSTVAGSGERGHQDGAAGRASFDGPIGIAVDRLGNIFVADTYNDCIRKITANGDVATVAGAGVPGFKDGEPDSALFDTPCGVAVDTSGNLFVSDTGNNAVRKISATGEVATFAGGSRGRQDGQGDQASFDHPVGIAGTHDGFLFVADESSGRIRMITPEGLVRTVAGDREGFANGIGPGGRFNRPAGIAVDNAGTLYCSDGDNYLIRKVTAAPSSSVAGQDDDAQPIVIQPSAEAADTGSDPMMPVLDRQTLGIGSWFPWPLYPQEHWHEIAGVVGEARGAPGGVALDHIHSGLDIHGKMGEQALSVLDDKVTSPISNWGFGDSGEGIHIGLMSYIHVRIGRDARGNVNAEDRFKARVDSTGAVTGVRVRRGSRFRVGDVIGTLNQLNHVHLNLGPWNAQANPIQFPFVEFKDTVSPVIEPGGIEVWDSSGRPFVQRREGRLMVSGDVSIVVAAYDRVDGNAVGRKLGLYKMGYQLVREDGEAAAGFESPIITMVFDRLPSTDKSVFLAYAPGSGVSAYGTPTKFRYIITNIIRHGEAREGTLRTSSLAPGNYKLKIIAEDFAGNRAFGKGSELPIAIQP
jgi:sugar lactone lactonase YvrE